MVFFFISKKFKKILIYVYLIYDEIAKFQPKPAEEVNLIYDEFNFIFSCQF